MEFAGKVAVITGGASGIGKGIVHALLSRGASVVVADIEQGVLDATVAELSPLGALRGVRCDVTDAASITAWRPPAAFWKRWAAASGRQIARMDKALSLH